MKQLLTKIGELASINDSNGGCCYRVSRVYPFNTFHHSSIQSTAHGADYYPGYQWWLILTREPWKSDRGCAYSQRSRYTTGSKCRDGCCCDSHILGENTELPSMIYICSVTCQLQLISCLTNWGHWRRRKLHQSCTEAIRLQLLPSQHINHELIYILKPFAKSMVDCRNQAKSTNLQTFIVQFSTDSELKSFTL